MVVDGCIRVWKIVAGGSWVGAMVVGGCKGHGLKSLAVAGGH